MLRHLTKGSAINLKPPLTGHDPIYFKCIPYELYNLLKEIFIIIVYSLLRHFTTIVLESINLFDTVDDNHDITQEGLCPTFCHITQGLDK